LFVLLFCFCLPLYCMSFFDLRLLISPLLSSNISHKNRNVRIMKNMGLDRDLIICFFKPTTYTFNQMFIVYNARLIGTTFKKSFKFVFERFYDNIEFRSRQVLKYKIIPYGICCYILFTNVNFVYLFNLIYKYLLRVQNPCTIYLIFKSLSIATYLKNKTAMLVITDRVH
jgi:hypothetical protein